MRACQVSISRHGSRNPEESAARRFLHAGAFVGTDSTKCPQLPSGA
jgi:hypothetical protein